MTNTIKLKNADGNWMLGTIDGIEFNAKVYSEPSEYGINGGKVSKLWIKGILNYDRGWDIKPKGKEAKAMMESLLKYFKDIIIKIDNNG